jgi:hypothetical protein
MHFGLTDLRLFAAVVDEGSITAAACPLDNRTCERDVYHPSSGRTAKSGRCGPNPLDEGPESAQLA